jgi:hypothetical protein
MRRKVRLNDAEVARDNEVRAMFSQRPTKSQLLETGDYAGPMSLEEFLAWRSGKTSAPLTAQLQAAIKACDASLYSIAQGSGVSAPILQRFMSGERGITLDTAGKLAAYVGLSLMPSAHHRRD